MANGRWVWIILKCKVDCFLPFTMCTYVCCVGRYGFAFKKYVGRKCWTYYPDYAYVQMKMSKCTWMGFSCCASSAIDLCLNGINFNGIMPFYDSIFIFTTISANSDWFFFGFYSHSDWFLDFNTLFRFDSLPTVVNLLLFQCKFFISIQSGR